MIMRLGKNNHHLRAVTLVETMVAMVIFVIAVFSLYAGISLGFSIVNQSRENLRATQIMVEKMETIRLYSWDQLKTPGFIPGSFTEKYDPNAGTNGWSGNLTYNGTIVLTNGPAGLSYSTNLMSVIINLSWTTKGHAQSRQMTTFVARNGLQDYIY